MEMVECGAVALGIILGYYKRFITIEQLRIDCQVSRDGSNADNIIIAAEKHGLEADAYELEFEDFEENDLPFIAYYRFNHFLVVEGFDKKYVYINDPEYGHRRLTLESFKKSYSGIAIICKPGENFEKYGKAINPIDQIYRLVKKQNISFLYLFFCGMMVSLLSLITPIFSKMFVDNYLVDYAQSTLNLIVIGLLVTLILKAGLSYIRDGYTGKLINKIISINSERFFQHIIRLPLSFFAQRNVGDIVFRMASIRLTILGATHAILDAGIQIFMVLTYLILLLYLNLQIGFTIIFISLLNIFIFYTISETKKEKSMQVTVDLGQYYSQAFSRFRNIESIKASGMEQDLFTKVVGSQAKLSNSIVELDAKSTILSLIPGSLNMIAGIAVLIMGAVQIINGQMTVGTLIAIQTITIGFMTPITNLIQIASQVQELSGNLAKLDDVMNYKIDPQVDLSHFTSTDRLMLEEEPKLSGLIEIKNVSFSFNTIENPTLKDINMTILPGEHVALVGASGSGKSTLVKLIANLYTPTKGEIYVDRTALSKNNRLILANSIAVVDQDFILFNGTVRDNLKIWDDSISDEDMINAAKDACIHEDISSRENGYDTLLIENASNFSGGQRQRIEIARALLTNPNILIFDEATSELDPIIEDQIYDNIRKRGCTMIIVAHRLNTIINSDKIVVFEQGKIIQMGTHDELIAQSGKYQILMSYL